MKASLFNEPETFIPTPVQKISDLIGENLPVLTEELKTAILEALNSENTTEYELAKKENVQKFLEEHMGEKLFTISW